MNTNKDYKYLGCIRKKTYRRKEALTKAAIQSKTSGDEIKAYKCLYGHHWHIGHPGHPSKKRPASEQGVRSLRLKPAGSEEL